MKAKKLLALGIASVMSISLLAGCGGGETAQTGSETTGGATYAFVAKDVQNPIRALKLQHLKSRLKPSTSLLLRT